MTWTSAAASRAPATPARAARTATVRPRGPLCQRQRRNTSSFTPTQPVTATSARLPPPPRPPSNPAADVSLLPSPPRLLLPGSFSCSACPAGFRGRGETGCRAISNCTFGNGGCERTQSCSWDPVARESVCGPCASGYDTTAEGCSLRLGCKVVRHPQIYPRTSERTHMMSGQRGGLS